MKMRVRMISKVTGFWARIIMSRKRYRIRPTSVMETISRTAASMMPPRMPKMILSTTVRVSSFFFSS